MSGVLTAVDLVRNEADPGAKITIVTGADELTPAQRRVQQLLDGYLRRPGKPAGPRSPNCRTATRRKYRTTNGTATAENGDYSAVALTTVTFEPGETAKTVSVTVNGDAATEKNETFNLVLSAPVGAMISDTSGSATVINDD